jgi:hypothetical protein
MSVVPGLLSTGKRRVRAALLRGGGHQSSLFGDLTRKVRLKTLAALVEGKRLQDHSSRADCKICSGTPVPGMARIPAFGADSGRIVAIAELQYASGRDEPGRSAVSNGTARSVAGAHKWAGPIGDR